MRRLLARCYVIIWENSRKPLWTSIGVTGRTHDVMTFHKRRGVLEQKVQMRILSNEKHCCDVFVQHIQLVFISIHQKAALKYAFFYIACYMLLCNKKCVIWDTVFDFVIDKYFRQVNIIPVVQVRPNCTATFKPRLRNVSKLFVANAVKDFSYVQTA